MSSHADRPTRDRRSSSAHRLGSRDARSPSRACSCGRCVPVPPPGTAGITTNTIGTFWQIFENAEYGFGRFEVAGPAVLPAHQRFRLEFRLLQWHWRLAGVTLPENIQNLLADELAKALRK